MRDVTIRADDGSESTHSAEGDALAVQLAQAAERSWFWLEAGATGSFGTVVEPCNHLQKFPIPPVVIWHYAEGDTLIEAYWKSVAWPGEGVFIGEPLAHPFAPRLVDVSSGQATLRIYSPVKRQAQLEESVSPIGPFHAIIKYPITQGMNSIKILLPKTNFYYRIKF